MNFKFITLLLTVISSCCNNVSCIPLTSSNYHGLLRDSIPDIDDDSEIVEVVSNEIPNAQAQNIIDLSIYGSSLYGVPDTNKTGRLVSEFKANTSSVNPEELGSYLEGDILMPQNPVILKNGLPSKSSRWPYGEVPFEIAGDFTDSELDVIAFAIDEYHAQTCIRFVPHTTETDFISIVRGNSGCWSSIGRVGGKQEVNLQTPGCLTKPGTAIHELMHVLGFLHEQNRQERDSYVTIQYQNIHERATSNFQKVPRTAAFGVGYDYGSVMHYSATAFSHNGKPTIVAKVRCLCPIAVICTGIRENFITNKVAFKSNNFAVSFEI